MMTFQMPSKRHVKKAALETGDILCSRFFEYCVECLLGQGQFGEVLKCTRMKDRKTVAIKMIKREDLDIAKHEVAALKKIRSLDPDECNLVKWYGSFIDKGHICLEFEHLDKSLYDYMKERKCRPVPLKQIRPIVHQIASALNHLKDARVMHTDLKLDNVMFVDHQRKPFRVKLIDFGLARDVSSAKAGTLVQSISFRAPEIILGLPFTEAIDIWSLGCLAAALYFGSLIFPGRDEHEMIKYIVEVQGQPPDSMLNHGLKTANFFMRDSTDTFWKLKPAVRSSSDTALKLKENRFSFTSLNDLLDVGDISCAEKTVDLTDKRMFVNMLKGMFELDDKKRDTPLQVLEHPFISMTHIAKKYFSSHHIRSCFEMMEVCQEKNGLSQALGSSLSSLRLTRTAQQNGLHLKESHLLRPHHTNPHLYVRPSDTKTGAPRQDFRQYNRVDNATRCGLRTKLDGYNPAPGIRPTEKIKTVPGQVSGSHTYNRLDNANQYGLRSKQAVYNHQQDVRPSDKMKTGPGQVSGSHTYNRLDNATQYGLRSKMAAYNPPPGIRPTDKIKTVLGQVSGSHTYNRLDNPRGYGCRTKQAVYNQRSDVRAPDKKKTGPGQVYKSG